jgi:hypothetical protein
MRTNVRYKYLEGELSLIRLCLFVLLISIVVLILILILVDVIPIHIVLVIIFVIGKCPQPKDMPKQFVGKIVNGASIACGWNVGIA